jgi:hypothetical protein
MSSLEVTEPIRNSLVEVPNRLWWIVEGEVPERRLGRYFAHYFYRNPRSAMSV